MKTHQAVYQLLVLGPTALWVLSGEVKAKE